MRYSAEHKEATRRKVVVEAAAALRLEGPERLGVAEVMKRAGLTHGGFYAHFPSKDALLVAAIEEAFAQGRARFEQGGKTPREQLSAFVNRYVSMTHRDHPESGCLATCMLNDIPRQSEPAREAFDRGLQAMAARLARLMEAGDPQTRPEIARSCISEMVGAVAVARAIADPIEAQQWLDQSRRQVRARLGLGEAHDDEVRS